jgi:hypothetical protein
MRFKVGDCEVEATPEEIQRAIADLVAESPSDHLQRLRDKPETVFLPFGAFPLPRVIARAYGSKDRPA